MFCVKRAKSIAKEKDVREKLLPILKTSNKKAVSKMLGISRNLFYYKSQKGNKPRTAKETVNCVIDFDNREDAIVTYPNKRKTGKPLKVLRFTKKRTHQMFLEETGLGLGLTTFSKL